MMPKGIALVGGNGSGKTTLGAALSKEINYKHMDIEDYYFVDSETPYAISRTKEEVKILIQNDIEKNPHFIISAVNADLGEKINLKYECVIYLTAPLDLRISRVKHRSYDKFGDRVLEGGDMYEQEQAFFDYVATRTMSKTNDWVNKLSCPIIYVDGTKSTLDNVNLLIKNPYWRKQK